MDIKSTQKDSFYQDRGERSFLYILLVVIILIGFILWVLSSAQAKKVASGILGDIGESSVETYQYLVDGVNNKIEDTFSTSAENDNYQIDVSGKNITDSYIFLRSIENRKILPKKLSSKSNLDKIRNTVYYRVNERNTANQSTGITARYPSGRYIDVDLSSQLLTLFQDGREVGSYAISSGSSTYPTPTGSYQINSKALNAYSSKYDLYMPYWMAFVGSLYGIHELPEYPNGYKEGQEYLGQAVSHGCIRLGVGAAERVYNFSPVGTRVYIHN
jgi:lipoprotein-anchoring transpeptidase ErfK/SrfK